MMRRYLFICSTRARHRAGTQAVHCIVNIQNDIQMHVSILGSGSTMQLYVQFNVHCMVNHTSLLILGTRSRHPSGSRSRSPRSCSLHIIAYKCVDLYTIICKERDLGRNAISEPTHVHVVAHSLIRRMQLRRDTARRAVHT